MRSSSTWNFGDGEIWYEERNRPPAIFSNKWGDFHLLFAPLQPSPTLPSRLLNALDEGDVLLVTRLDRLARSTRIFTAASEYRTRSGFHP